LPARLPRRGTWQRRHWRQPPKEPALGNERGNAVDKLDYSTLLCGEGVLTEPDTHAIDTMRGASSRVNAIADRFGISRPTV